MGSPNHTIITINQGHAGTVVAGLLIEILLIMFLYPLIITSLDAVGADYDQQVHQEDRPGLHEIGRICILNMGGMEDFGADAQYYHNQNWNPDAK